MSKKKEKNFYESHFKEDSFDQQTYDFIRRISGKSKSTIVELGCGSGSWTKELVKNGNFVVGLDFSISSIKELKKNLGGSNIEVVVADLECLPFKNNFADQFFFGWVLHHATNVPRSLKEVKRCLRNNGNVVMIEPNGTFLRVLTHKVGVLLNKVVKKRLTSYEEKPLNIYKVCNILEEIGLKFQVFPWGASERTAVKCCYSQRHSLIVTLLTQIYVLLLRMYQLVLPDIFGSSDFVLIAFPNIENPKNLRYKEINCS